MLTADEEFCTKEEKAWSKIESLETKLSGARQSREVLSKEEKPTKNNLEATQKALDAKKKELYYLLESKISLKK